MWELKTESLDGAKRHRVRIYRDEKVSSYLDVVRAWQKDSTSRTAIVDFLADVKLNAYRWETTPVMNGIAHDPFEFVLLDAPGLVGKADAKAFADQFKNAAGNGVVVFPNLEQDATLIAPVPIDASSSYRHLAGFCRTAPVAQQHEFWEAVGREAEKRIDNQPMWVSTSGAGVSWLHIRIESSPKYYSYADYARGW